MTRRRKGTLDGVSKTLAAPVPVVWRIIPRHGKVPGRTPLQITLVEIWKVQKILNSRKGSLSQEGNTKVYDLNQKTMQALGILALVYARFEARADLEVGTSEGDLLHADMRTAVQDLQKFTKNRNG